MPPIPQDEPQLQQDPEYLKTHPWFAYLKPPAEGHQMWEGNKKIQAYDEGGILTQRRKPGIPFLSTP
ncbi:MAG: hypothetical protein ACLSHC_14605 [Bilophila wadsworthia]